MPRSHPALRARSVSGVSPPDMGNRERHSRPSPVHGPATDRIHVTFRYRDPEAKRPDRRPMVILEPEPDHHRTQPGPAASAMEAGRVRGDRNQAAEFEAGVNAGQSSTSTTIARPGSDPRHTAPMGEFNYAFLLDCRDAVAQPPELAYSNSPSATRPVRRSPIRAIRPGTTWRSHHGSVAPEPGLRPN